MAIIRAQATGNGRKVRWSEFCTSSLVDSSFFRPEVTTVLTDVIDDVVKLCQSVDPKSRIQVLMPNGFTTTHFTLAIIGKGFEVTCSRRLERGWFPLNPLAAEFGSNFDAIITTGGVATEISEAIVAMLVAKYRCTVAE